MLSSVAVNFFAVDGRKGVNIQAVSPLNIRTVNIITAEFLNKYSRKIPERKGLFAFYRHVAP